MQVKIKLHNESDLPVSSYAVCFYTVSTSSRCGKNENYFYMNDSSFGGGESSALSKEYARYTYMSGKSYIKYQLIVDKNGTKYAGYNTKPVQLKTVFELWGSKEINIGARPAGAEVYLIHPRFYLVNYDDNKIIPLNETGLMSQQFKKKKLASSTEIKYFCAKSLVEAKNKNVTSYDKVTTIGKKIDMVEENCFDPSSNVYKQVAYIGYMPPLKIETKLGAVLQTGQLISKPIIFRCIWNGCTQYKPTKDIDYVYIAKNLVTKVETATRSMIFSSNKELKNRSGFTFLKTKTNNQNKHVIDTIDGQALIADRLDAGNDIMRITKKVSHFNSNFIGSKIDFVQGARLPAKINIGSNKGSDNYLTSEFIRSEAFQKNNPGSSKIHGALDVGWSKDAPKPKIYNICTGNIQYKTDTCVTDSGKYGDKCGGGYGNRFYIICNEKLNLNDSKKNLETRIIYAHLEQESIKKFKGTVNSTVVLGKYLAKANHTGSSTANHLHVEGQVKIAGHWKKAPLNCINWDDNDLDEDCYDYTTDQNTRETESSRE